MADLNMLGDFETTASASAGLAAAGITQAGLTASLEACRADASSKKASSLDGTPLGTSALKVNGNPLGVGPVPAPPFIQPDSGPRTPNPAVSVQVESVKNPLNIVSPVPAPKYVQPGVAASPPPAPGQLSTMSYGSIGTSGAVRVDGSRIF